MKQGLIIGAIVGGILALLTVVGGSIAWAQKKSNDLRRGWHLVPIVATSRPLKRGDRISAGALVSRDTPEQFVTSSVVPAAKLGSLEQRLLSVDLPANAMVRWSDLESEPPDPRRQAGS